MQSDGRFSRLQRESDVLLLANREYDRLEAASVLVSFPGDFLETPSTFSEYPNRMTVAEDSLGFRHTVQVDKGVWFTTFYDALYDSGYGYVLSDTALSPDRWAGYRAVLLATFEYLDSGTQKALVDYAAGGGVLVIGPEAPSLDSLMRPSDVITGALAEGASTPVPGGRSASVGFGRIVVLDDREQVPAALDSVLQEATASRVSKTDTRLDVVVHRDRDEPSRRVVFVCNPTDTPISASVGIDASVDTANNLWEDGLVPVKDGELVLELEPYSIAIADVTVPVDVTS
jgi:beta-galactosidase